MRDEVVSGSSVGARRGRRARRTGALSMLVAAGLGALAALAACQHEDWGGPKGPPPPKPTAAPAWTPPGFDAAAGPASGSGPAAASDAGTGNPATAPLALGDAGALNVHVTSDLNGGALPGWEETVAGLRPALRDCARGKGEVDASVEIVARVGPKGKVTGTEKTGGSQYAQGVVACIVHEIEKTTFAKPKSGAPRISIRVTLRRD